MEVEHGLVALHGEQLRDPLRHGGLGLVEGGVIHLHRLQPRAGQVVGERIGDDEVAVGQPLHEGARTEAIGAVIREVRLAENVQAGDVAHQVVVDPQPAHDVVHGRVDAHRRLVRVLAGDALVHLEQVAVALLDGLAAEALERVGEVEVDRAAGRPDAAPLVADHLGVARRHVARHQVAEARVAPLEEVVALGLRDVLRCPMVALLLRHPDAAVVAQAFAHQGQLRLVLAALGNAGRVDLYVAGVGHVGAALGAAPGSGDVAVPGVGRQEVDVAVAAGAEQHGVGGVALHGAGDEVAGDDAARPPVDQDEVEHLAAREDLDLAAVDLPHQRAVGAEQQLLSGLAAGVEGARHLGAAEGAVGEQPAVLASEGHSLRDALVDDVDAHLGEAVHVGLARSVVAPLDGVVKEAVDRVAVVLVVLRRVDAALRGDAVGAARAVEDREGEHVVAELAERGRCGRSCQARAHHDHGVLPPVGGAHQTHGELVPVPLALEGTSRNLAVEDHRLPPMK